MEAKLKEALEFLQDTKVGLFSHSSWKLLTTCCMPPEAYTLGCESQIPHEWEVTEVRNSEGAR